MSGLWKCNNCEERTNNYPPSFQPKGDGERQEPIPKDVEFATLDTSMPRPTPAIEEATMTLCKLVESEMGVRNGTTALYWHLVDTIQNHAGKRINGEKLSPQA